MAHSVTMFCCKPDTDTHGVVLFLPLLGTTTQTEHQVEGRLLLDVVVAQGAAILELLAGEDETLLVRRDTVREITLDKDESNFIRNQTHPSLSWILPLTASMESEDSTSRVMVLPVRLTHWSISLQPESLPNRNSRFNENLHPMRQRPSKPCANDSSRHYSLYRCFCLSNELNGGVVDKSETYRMRKSFARGPGYIARQLPLCCWPVRIKQ